MPIVEVKTVGATSREQRERLIAGLTDVVATELGKPREKIIVLLHEIRPDHWGAGGAAVTRPPK